MGGALSATGPDGAEILITRPTDGEIYAFSAICTHQGCIVEPGDGELACPCHRSSFDLSTGQVRSGPAPQPLPPVAVTVAQDGTITV